MSKDEALKLAQEALETKGEHHPRVYQAITAIKEALAQPEQEPVAKVTSETGNPDITMSWWHEPALPVGTPLYTTPQQRTWVGLTDEEISELIRATHNTGSFVRAIEAKLKEKNTSFS